MIGGILFLSCLSVCLSVNFNIRYNFWTIEIEASCLACILHYWCPFKWHQGQWSCDLDFGDRCAKNSLFRLAAGGIVFHKHTLIFFVSIFANFKLICRRCVYNILDILQIKSVKEMGIFTIWMPRSVPGQEMKTPQSKDFYSIIAEWSTYFVITYWTHHTDYRHCQCWFQNAHCMILLRGMLVFSWSSKLYT